MTRNGGARKAKEAAPAKPAGKPKRPLSAFFLFAADHRPQVRKDLEKNGKEGVKVRVGDISKKIGVMWKAVDEETKAKYQKKADEEKSKYQDALAKFNAKQDEPAAAAEE